MGEVCGAILPCDVGRGRCFAMPNRKALFAHGEAFNNLISRVDFLLFHSQTPFFVIM